VPLEVLEEVLGVAGRPHDRQNADRLLVVDCLLPGQVRQLGTGITYMAPRRAIKSTGSDCAIRGGEYTAYDRSNYTSALKVWLPSAQGGDKVAQTNVGEIYEKGAGTAPDYANAALWYQKASDQGYPRALINLGFLYENGRGVRMDKARAHGLYQRGCEGSSCQPSNLGGCVNAGRGDRDGIGVPVDETKAAAMFREACDRAVNPDDIHAAENGSRACSLLGALYIAGDGIPKDLEKGLELSVAGCDRGDSFGCFNAAAVYTAGAGVPADAAKADSYLDLACKGGDGEGCYDLATACEKGNGVPRDAKRATELRKKACELGFAKACGSAKK